MLPFNESLRVSEVYIFLPHIIRLTFLRQSGIMQLINNEAKTACEIAELEEDYENAISQAVLQFISESNVKVDLVCNHGQTIFHEGFSLKTSSVYCSKHL